ncbi:hypothetical protein SARC_00897 [Sphaeroforma arctica JP610]|uniref:[acyl-carrier-protein] S-malonyltransferase n=1 Tax=Sphaeroforma arctica JP610 TaxID=667725 RepID=A0A0L0GDI0_9EUKA|nr:hypothetical protein SARC_00897 [Sphaeroforma arctica JP610]KNC86946.1 hypothetical protein SARC_00897 [Sphaeroforma arctica JP610]|eukprot:XP_014160848.1 hypothetical protein SARC_00897 [Sphaeroforma arctica JP610]
MVSYVRTITRRVAHTRNYASNRHLRLIKFYTTERTEKNTCFMFPGQGTQHVGMGKDMFQNIKQARQMLQEADSVLGFSLSRLMFEGPEATLTKTENAQPAILINSLAHFETEVKTSRPEQVQNAACVMGFSLGEYSALTAAGALSVPDAVRLVHHRGKAMQECVVGLETAMVSMFPCSVELAEEIVVEGQKLGACDISNHNSSTQVTISGMKDAVDAAVLYAKSRGVRRCASLQVSCPFHSPLIKGAEDVMRELLETTQINTPRTPVISNVTGQPMSDPNEIRRLLVDQVCGRVVFADSILTAQKMGVTEFIEVGGGKNMSRFVEQTLKANKIQ